MVQSELFGEFKNDRYVVCHSCRASLHDFQFATGGVRDVQVIGSWRNGDDRVTVSPAVLKMGGVILTPKEQGLRRVYGRSIEEIFAEMSLHGQAVESFAGLMVEHKSPQAHPGKGGRLW